MKQVLRDALDHRGYTELTPVQTAVLEPEFEGRDMLVSAQTGSGKTVGFGLAIAQSLLQEEEKFGTAGAPLGLVIAPTRELALQVQRELSWLFAKAGGVIASCVGGMDMRDERRALARGAHIVTATPGRLRDHIMRGSIDLSALKAVVLDEADEMLDLGFREDLEFILSEAPEERQTLLFSATVPKSIVQLAQNYQNDAERIVVKSETKQHADITYQVMQVADNDTEKAVINTLLYYNAPNAIVFANTRATVNRLTTRLSNRGLRVVSLSGELSQAERTHALQAMRDGRANICVATDVAARGIDLPNLDLVVHAELPSNHETMLHRSGRTGRAGRKGVSALIATRRSRRKAERVLFAAKVDAEWTEAPSAEAVNERETSRMFADEIWQAPVAASEQELVERLETTFSPAQLAAAYLRLHRSLRSAPEELSESGAKPEPRPDFGPSVWFAITGGRDAGAEPRRILPMLCKTSDLTKHDIGAIRVRQDYSYVQVKQARVDAFLASVDPSMELEPGAVLSQVDELPDFLKSVGGAANRDRKAGFKPKRHRGVKSPGADDLDEKQPRRRSKPRRAEAEDHQNTRYEEKRERTPSRQNADSEADAGNEGRKRSSKPKGPKPPVGKPSSKKNRARKALATKTGGKAKRPAKAKQRKPRT